MGMKEFVMQETEEMTTFGSVWKRYEPVAELVRCKDCKYAAPDMVCSHESEWGNEISRNRGNPNWYCADGDRR